MNTKREVYQSYLLRLWCGELGRPYRATLQSTTDQHIHHFGSLEALFAHLLEQMETTSTSTPTQKDDQDD